MAYRRIHNRGEGGRREELNAAATITPGMLLEVTSSGTVQAHSTAGGRHQKMVALEDSLQGKTVSDNYSSANPVNIQIMAPGDVYNLLIAAGEALNPGDPVYSAGDGTLVGESGLASAGLIAQEVGRINADEAAFTALAANTLKAVQISD